MKTRIYWINEELLGDHKLGLMARPRGNDWLEDEVKNLVRSGVNCVVCLLEKSELKELELEEEEEICEKYEIEFIHYPLPDMEIPPDEITYVNVVQKISDRLDNGNSIVIHCRMGIGRSSMVAGGVMIKRGANEKDVFNQISKHRLLKVPDRAFQKKWVEKLTVELLK